MYHFDSVNNVVLHAKTDYFLFLKFQLFGDGELNLNLDLSKLTGGGNGGINMVEDEISSLIEKDLSSYDFFKMIPPSEMFVSCGAASGEASAPTSGQELVSYNPSLFELTEDDSHFFDDSNNMFLDDELQSMLTMDREKLKQSNSNSTDKQ